MVQSFASRLSTLFLILLLGGLFVPISGAQAATFSLSPTAVELGRACAEEVQILLNTEEMETTGVDMFLYYNAQEVEIIDQDPFHEGVQIRNGGLYEGYSVSVVDEAAGTIRSSAFSPRGTYNSGEAAEVYATVVFRAKPGVEQTSFRFDYTFGSTIDSNVIDENLGDLLNDVESASYRFVDRDCGDVQAPEVLQTRPRHGERGVALDASIQVTLTDDRSGVDPASIRVRLDGEIYQEGVEGFATEGEPQRLDVAIDPLRDFAADEAVLALVEAADVEGNRMKPYLLVFNYPLPDREPVCGNQIVEAGESCEPPGTAVCDLNCQEILPLHGVAEEPQSPNGDYLLIGLAALVLLLYLLWRYQVTQMEQSPKRPKKKA